MVAGWDCHGLLGTGFFGHSDLDIGDLDIGDCIESLLRALTWIELLYKL